MEAQKRNKTLVSRKNLKKNKQSELLENIINEYCLKRNSFHPTNPSPNIFIGKLELRMKKYYNSLYNSTKE